MIFSLDLYAATFLVCGLWMLLVFSFLAGRHVKMGEIDDPHKNLFRPDNDLNVCNYDMFGSFGSFGTQNDNTSDEIACSIPGISGIRGLPPTAISTLGAVYVLPAACTTFADTKLASPSTKSTSELPRLFL